MITQEQLKELIHYDPDTGAFTNVTTRGKATAGRTSGNLSKNGKDSTLIYRRIYISGKFYKAHRLAFLYMDGSWPAEEVDHINGDGSDNRWCNLRKASRHINGRNTRLKSNNTSGLHGIAWSKSRNKWRVRIVVDHKEIFLGRYSDLFEAVCVRKAAELKHGFHNNHGRCE